MLWRRRGPTLPPGLSEVNGIGRFGRLVAAVASRAAFLRRNGLPAAVMTRGVATERRLWPDVAGCNERFIDAGRD
jgi:hypothetical protein